MGHDVIKCLFCGDLVMEGRNDWECDCGAVCSEATKFAWKKQNPKDVGEMDNID